MEFLRQVLHIQAKRANDVVRIPLPNYLTARYAIYEATLETQKVFLLYPKTELDMIVDIKQHIQKLQSVENIPIVLVLQKITIAQRQSMITAGISFIVENKQCYLPFLGTVLTERCNTETEESEKLRPSAQLLLFYFIYRGEKELLANDTVEALSFSAMTITRAVRQLEQLGLIKTYKRGVMKVITSEFAGKELFKKAQHYLINPIKEILYIPLSLINEPLLASGEQALSDYSMLNPPRMPCFAVESAKPWRKYSTTTLIDETEQAMLQVWRYNPQILSNEQTTVDILSLATCFLSETDERIEEAVEEMLNSYWR